MRRSAGARIELDVEALRVSWTSGLTLLLKKRHKMMRKCSINVQLSLYCGFSCVFAVYDKLWIGYSTISSLDTGLCFRSIFLLYSFMFSLQFPFENKCLVKFTTCMDFTKRNYQSNEGF